MPNAPRMAHRVSSSSHVWPAPPEDFVRLMPFLQLPQTTHNISGIVREATRQPHLSAGTVQTGPIQSNPATPRLRTRGCHHLAYKPALSHILYCAVLVQYLPVYNGLHCYWRRTRSSIHSYINHPASILPEQLDSPPICRRKLCHTRCADTA
ncbi:hypothetical protein C7212DRAFT_319978 [Tuber magnatum]|uniref:Uncharacterized protein n=1 Tax=Tuber magnatum TaxID=42249 RepID=A0A317SQG8_9PEZI|nr:hypothetical protein C7212DRAFT_319978 [Tuber magnatum]